MILLNRLEMKKFIQSLSADEASQVLKTLLDNNPDLTKTIYDISIRVAGDVDADEIMDEVYYALDSLDVDDLSSRSGRTRHGYVEPCDAAWEMFEEAMTPFVNEMKKNQQRSLPALAKTYCIGIIKGLLMYEQESCSDLKDWVTDAPGEYIDTVVEEWKKGNPSNEDIAEVMSVVKGGKS
jgi:hypothetical protein